LRRPAAGKNRAASAGRDFKGLAEDLPAVPGRPAGFAARVDEAGEWGMIRTQREAPS
jgi:hypothetical protein